MATRNISIMGWNTVPDTSGDVYFEPASLNFGSNDLYPHMVLVFADTSTRIGVRGAFRVPENYASGANLVIVWGSTATSGDVEWDFDYTSIAEGETLDPSADQESVNAADTTNGTARFKNEVTISLTDGNFAIGDTVLFELFRDGTDAGDTLTGSAYVFGVFFEYTTT